MSSSYLSIEGLSVSYGATRVLDNVSLGVERGEMIALLGSSGCGKTTLLRSIAGFVLPDAGTIRVDGQDITRVMAQKLQAVRCHQSQVALLPYDRAVRGLNIYRGAIAWGCQYAEVFRHAHLGAATESAAEPAGRNRHV